VAIAIASIAFIAVFVAFAISSTVVPLQWLQVAGIAVEQLAMGTAVAATAFACAKPGLLEVVVRLVRVFLVRASVVVRVGDPFASGLGLQGRGLARSCCCVFE